jgi:predicted dehydrogenase
MEAMRRRTFAGLTALSTSHIFGANERIRCGTIGSGGRGTWLTAAFKELGAEMRAICDIYEPHLANGLKAASTGARGYEDYRKLLEDRSIDAVIIASPEHWHCQMLVDAVNAGKDVYVEKPLAHSVDEGFRMVDAVRRTRRIAQVGTQRRSYDLYHEAKGIFASGMLGEIRLVNTWWLNTSGSSLSRRELRGKLNWDLFLGPAPKREFDPVRYFNWLQFWDYGNGILVGQAAHIVDGVHMMMDSTFPLYVNATGAKPRIAGAEIPETGSMTVEYPDYMLVFTLSYKAMRYRMFNDQMQQFHGAKARMDLGRESYAVIPQNSAVDLKIVRERRDPDSFERASHDHIRNFLECLRDRKEPNAPIEVGNHVNVVNCMAIQSMRSGRKLRFDATTRAVSPV